MRVLVCGGRDYNDVDRFAAVINTLDDDRGPIKTVIHGAARGADCLAHDWAWRNEREVDYYPAAWSLFGNAAGVIRNKRMLAKGKPDLVVAFPGGKGTANMVKLAKEANVEVIEVK